MDKSANIDYLRNHDLTIEEIRECPAFAKCNDEEAVVVIDALKAFAKIAYDLYEKEVKKF